MPACLPSFTALIHLFLWPWRVNQQNRCFGWHCLPVAAAVCSINSQLRFICLRNSALQKFTVVILEDLKVASSVYSSLSPSFCLLPKFEHVSRVFFYYRDCHINTCCLPWNGSAPLLMLWCVDCPVIHYLIFFPFADNDQQARIVCWLGA